MIFRLFFIILILAANIHVNNSPAADYTECPCRRLYPIDKAKFAFMGRLQSIAAVEQDGPGFPYRKIHLNFKIEEPWRSVPVHGDVSLATDDTSCGYGFQLAPTKQETKIGQVFAVFGEEENMSVCNSVIMHSSLLLSSNKKFVYFEDADDN